MQIKDIPLGSIVYDANSLWEFKTGNGYTGSGVTKPIEWVLVAKNHSGYPSNTVTLFSNEVIGKIPFDTSNSSTWTNSSLRNLLNSTFYNALSVDFKGLIIPTTTLQFTTTVDNIFLFSRNELNLTGDTYNAQIPYLNNNTVRIKVLNGVGTIYWTRTIEGTFGNYLRRVGSSGIAQNGSAVNATDTGVVPALNILDTAIVQQVDTNIYKVVFWTPPDLKENVNGVYVDIETSYENVNGVWVEIDSMWENINGIWVKL